jgi:hypothetical protein
VADRGDSHRQQASGGRRSVAASACFIVGTNELENEALSDQELVKTYKDQGGVERGFHFLKDPLFLASSVTVSKPERIIALPCDHGALLAGLSFSRIPAADTLGRDRADDSRPGTQTYSTPDDAVGLSMF